MDTGTSRFRELHQIIPPLPPSRYIRLLRNFRFLFHRRPARRYRHGKTRISPGIRRHRTGQGRSAIREPKTPCFRGLQLSVWNFGSRPGKERLKTSVSGKWGQRKSRSPGARKQRKAWACRGTSGSRTLECILEPGRRFILSQRLHCPQAPTFHAPAVCGTKEFAVGENLKGDRCSLCDEFNVPV